MRTARATTTTTLAKNSKNNDNRDNRNYDHNHNDSHCDDNEDAKKTATAATTETIWSSMTYQDWYTIAIHDEQRVITIITSPESLIITFHNEPFLAVLSMADHYPAYSPYDPSHHISLSFTSLLTMMTINSFPYFPYKLLPAYWPLFPYSSLSTTISWSLFTINHVLTIKPLLHPSWPTPSAVLCRSVRPRGDEGEGVWADSEGRCLGKVHDGLI